MPLKRHAPQTKAPSESMVLLTARSTYRMLTVLEHTEGRRTVFTSLQYNDLCGRRSYLMRNVNKHKLVRV